jgi:hypothetical protein
MKLEKKRKGGLRRRKEEGTRRKKTKERMGRGRGEMEGGERERERERKITANILYCIAGEYNEIPKAKLKRKGVVFFSFVFVLRG